MRGSHQKSVSSPKPLVGLGEETGFFICRPERKRDEDDCSKLLPSSIPDVNSQGQVSLVAPAVMVVSGASLYAGAAVAVGLFESFSPFIVAWFRVAAAGVILLLLYRPPLRLRRLRL